MSDSAWEKICFNPTATLQLELKYDTIKLLLKFSNTSHTKVSYFISFFQLVNNGPSRISQTQLELRCPLSVQGHNLLYPLEFSTEGSINCTSDKNMNHLRLKVSNSHAHRCAPLEVK